MTNQSLADAAGPLLDSALSSKRELPSSTNSGPTRDMQKAETIILLLSKLAVHYYQADFTVEIARSRIKDMVGDLMEFAVTEIEKAVETYRRMPFPAGKFKPFPDSGMLRKLAADERGHKAELEKRGPGRIVPQFGESRPLMWWLQDRSLWRAHWREAEAPFGEKVRAHDGSYRDPERGAF